jgi:hypothetical protein
VLALTFIGIERHQPTKDARWEGKHAMHRNSVMWVATSLCSLIAVLFLQPRPVMAQTTSDNIIYLNQAWSQDDRYWYYHFSQGLVVLSYDIFLNLEVADGQELFRSDANSERSD